ncbi:hypothetical protein QA648_10890 [Rhizobium sp. CB3171]|uniref:hypothetical protein n=1 Tax=Rhizobium sp. CB3171 TaxID=3039157 RepID=UPI0024B11938|nr:hypothetical protein [Rhizobium sp. CB3171]WFU00678.1 hypothetical protein QA648_10890 [Rhizobium sp. CB3171]
MSVENNANIVRVTGTVKEINGRSFFGRNGLDDIHHYAYLIIEDMSGQLLKFERVTTNEKIDPEVKVGNVCTFYFRRIWSWRKSVFHLIATESDNRGINHFALWQGANKVSHGLMMAKAVPGAYVLGLFLFALPARFTVGLGNVFWLALIPPIALIVLNRVTSLDKVRKDSIALQKELERSRIGQKFDGRELKTM